jgi:hypothetical protein
VVSDNIRFVLPILVVKRASVLRSSVVSMFTFGVIVIEVWSTQLPVWAFVLALAICASA